MRRSSRVVTAAVAGAACLALSGCGALGWHGYGGLSSSMPLEYGEDEGWTFYPPDGSEAFGEPVTWADEHDDAVPALDVSFTGDGPEQLDLDVSVAAASPDGWSHGQQWFVGTVDTAQPVTVLGSTGLVGTDPVLLTVSTWGEDDHEGAYWSALVRPADGGWVLAGDEADDAGGAPALEIDLADGSTVPETLDPQAEEDYWDETAGAAEDAWDDTTGSYSFDYAEAYDDAAEVLTIRVEGELDDEAELLVSAYGAEGSMGWSSLDLYQQTIGEAGTITVAGPPDLVGLGADASSVEVDVTVFADEDYTDWYGTLQVTDGVWTLEDDQGESVDGPVELVLDLDEMTLAPVGTD